jgi:Ca2+-binding RTX toxin-like protein
MFLPDRKGERRVMAIFSGTNGNDLIAQSTVPGVTFTLSDNGTDVIFAGDGNDTIRGNPTPSGAGANFSPSYYFGGNGNDSLAAPAGGNSVLYGDGGNDTLSSNTGWGQMLFGGNGNDLLLVNNPGATADGGFDNDTIQGSTGGDRLLGDQGADSILGGDGFDTIDGGVGANTILGGAGGDLISVTFSNEGNRLFGDGDSDTITGGIGNDTISGGDGFDVIDAGGGAGTDSISGGNENDRITTSGFGDDTMTGDAGDDTVFAAHGNNSISGGLGQDSLEGGFGNDTILGEDGNDTIQGGGGGGPAPGVANVLLGGVGSDQIFASFGADSIDGGADNDFIEAGAGNNTVLGGGGNDQIFAGSGSDRLSGEDGNDAVFGGGGGDTILGGLGNDRVDGGEGFDALDYSGLGAGINVTITISGGFLRAVKRDAGTLVGVDQVWNFETLIGTSSNDRLIGWGQDETFVGGDGNDSIDGGDGFDTARWDGPAAVVVNLLTGVATQGGFTDRLRKFDATNNSIESIVTGSGNDSILGDADGNFLRGREGADTLDGGGSGDTADYSGDTGGTAVFANLSSAAVDGVAAGTIRDVSNAIDVVFNIENVRGNNLGDTVIGSDAGNAMRGMRGGDYFDGRGGNDFVDHRSDSDGFQGGGETLAGTNDGFGVIVNLSSVAITRNFGTEGSVTVAGFRARDGWGDIDTLAGVESARGSNFNDLLVGAQRTVLLSATGINFYAEDRSFLRGMMGNDTIRAVAGSDGVVANYQDDTAGIVADLSVVVNGVRTIVDGWGFTDTLENVLNVAGTAFADRIVAATTGSYMRGRGGDDTLTGGAGFDQANFGSATSGVYVNLLLGTAEDGEGGTDSLSAIDLVSTSAFADTLVADAAGTHFFAGAGADSIVGGAGIDTLLYLTAADGGAIPVHDGVSVNLTAGTARDGDGTGTNGSLDRFTGIENVIGSHGADTITGNALANELVGAQGDDAISGGSEADTLAGNTGADTLDGGLGNDAMDGGAGDDLFLVNSGADAVTEAVGGGADTIRASASYTLGAGVEVEVLELTGAAARGAGNDFANRIIGTAGANTLDGGGLGDTLTGGAGNDQFFFERASDSYQTRIDHITDFASGFDRIAFSGKANLPFSGMDVAQIDFNGVVNVASANLVSGGYSQVLSGMATQLGAGLKASSTAEGLQVWQVVVAAGTAAGSYVFVNNGTAAASTASDMLIGITLIGGPLTAADFVLVG